MEAEIQAAEIEAPLEILSPGEQRLPLVFASPHSGSRYPPEFVEASALDRLMLRRSEHCFVHDRLNKKDDLTKEEIFALSDSLGPIENLNLSGGEPFIRKEFSEICRKFIQTNGVQKGIIRKADQWGGT